MQHTSASSGSQESPKVESMTWNQRIEKLCDNKIAASVITTIIMCILISTVVIEWTYAGRLFVSLVGIKDPHLVEILFGGLLTNLLLVIGLGATGAMVSFLHWLFHEIRNLIQGK